MAEENKADKHLRWAEEALRDIRERVEHAGTAEKMISEVSKILATYWTCKNRDVSHEV